MATRIPVAPSDVPSGTRWPTERLRFPVAGLAVVLSGFTLGGPVFAQQSGANATPSLHATRIPSGTIDLDGRLEEAAWARTPAATGFTQREPVDGDPPSERTEVRVLYTSRALYVGVRAFDAEPEAIVGRLARRDEVSESDLIALYFDCFHDHRTSFEFAVTPRGAIRDVYRFRDSPGGGDASWDPVWQVATAVDDSGWTAEFRIPFTQLRFNSREESWGFQVHRRIQRRAEDLYWAPFSKESSGFTSLFGNLEGLEDLPSPMRLELRPYVVARTRHRPPQEGSRYAPTSSRTGDVGLDVKYGVSSDFTLDMTVNPDFGQVEADPSVVNLSAFETYYPERRVFFVEGSGLFDHGVPGGDLFYSRRIGRPPQAFVEPPEGGTVEIPEASTIAAAAKLTGKTAGGLGLGIQSALTTRELGTLRDSTGAVVGDGPVQPAVHHFAARVEQDFRDGQTTVGAFATALNRFRGDDFPSLRSAAYTGLVDGRSRWNRNTYGFDWVLGWSHVQGSTTALLATQRSPYRYFQRPDAEHVEVDTTRTSLSGYSAAASAGKIAGTWRYGADAWLASPGLEVSDLGFQWTADNMGTGANVRYNRSRPIGPLRSFQVSAAFSQEWTTGGEPLGFWFRPIYFYATLGNNWWFDVNPLAVTLNRRSVSALRGGPSLRQNAWLNSWFDLGTDRRKPVSMDLWGNIGGIAGSPERWANGGGSVQVRPAPTLSGSLSLRYSWGRDPEQWVARRTVFDTIRYVLGEITQQTLVTTLRLDVTFLRGLSLQFYAQPFVSAGSYVDYKEVVAPHADRFEDRYRYYQDAVRCGEEACEVDLDGSGAADMSFGRPDFNFKEMRTTTVLRWEYRPGSVLYLAWQHGRSLDVSDPAFGGFGDLVDIFELPADNTFLLKLNYWVGF